MKTKRFLLLVLPFILSSCFMQSLHKPVCKCECKCPVEKNSVIENKGKTDKKETSNSKNFFSDDITIKDVLGDR